MPEPMAYAAVSADGSESVYVASLREQAEAACREYGWMLVPLFAGPHTWVEETMAVESAFERSGVKRTQPDDEPDQIIPMVNAMADEIELLRGYRDAAESDAAIAHLLVDKLRAQIASLAVPAERTVMDDSDIVVRLRQTRANMIGTDDEQHYWDCHDAANLIQSLRGDVHQWRSVADDPPEMGIQVLVAMPSGSVEVMRRKDNAGLWEWWDGDMDYLDIAHWMPLPEPPSRESVHVSDH